jgi:hypothetical protein
LVLEQEKRVDIKNSIKKRLIIFFISKIEQFIYKSYIIKQI